MYSMHNVMRMRLASPAHFVERGKKMGWRHLWWWLLATIKVIVTKIPYMNRSFVIVSSGRSGSTLLVQLLNTNKRILCGMEPLNRELLDKHQLRSADSRTLINYMLAMLLPINLWLRYTGFKLFNEQLEYCNLGLHEVALGLHHPPIIVLYRENLLETYVSLKIAFQNNIWYSEKQVNDCCIVVDWEDFCLYAEGERMRWKKTMTDLRGMKKIVISFDELTGSQQRETMYRLFTFLDLEVNHGAPIVPCSVRQNPQKLEKKIVNYHEIMERVHNSGHPITINLHSDELQNF